MLESQRFHNIVHVKSYYWFSHRSITNITLLSTIYSLSSKHYCKFYKYNINLLRDHQVKKNIKPTTNQLNF